MCAAIQQAGIPRFSSEQQDYLSDKGYLDDELSTLREFKFYFEKQGWDHV